MAEIAPAEGGKGGRLFGWLKAGVVSLCGLVSGAALMYFTPLVEQFVKPGKPVANFQYEVDGLKVAFHNRSSGAGDGWWDFGDGSALEPYSAAQGSVTHTFPRPGTYTVKLGLRNLFGEENERTVNVNLDAPAVQAPPTIDAFEVTPLQPNAYAPATFKVVSKVRNATLCVWAPGTENPLEVLNDLTGTQERYVCLKTPGVHILRLAAYDGKQLVERSASVQVERQPPGAVMAILNVTHQGVHVVTRQEPQPPVQVAFPPNVKEKVFRFTREFPARPGFQVVAARLAQPPARGAPLRAAPTLIVAPDRRKAVLTGELVRASNEPVKWNAAVVLTVEQRTAPVARVMSPVAKLLAVPGTTLLPLPALQGGWVSNQRAIHLNVQEGERSLWQCARPGSSGELSLNGRRFRVTASEAGDQLRLDVAELPGAGPLRPVGN